jgi:hypothetical protein
MTIRDGTSDNIRNASKSSKTYSIRILVAVAILFLIGAVVFTTGPGYTSSINSFVWRVVIAKQGVQQISHMASPNHKGEQLPRKDDDKGDNGGEDVGMMCNNGRMAWKVPFFYVPSESQAATKETSFCPGRECQAAVDKDKKEKSIDEHNIVWRPIQNMLEGYERDTFYLLRQLDHAALLARESELIFIVQQQPTLFRSSNTTKTFADKLAAKRGKLAQVLEADLFTLRRLLYAFQLTWALPTSESDRSDSSSTSILNNTNAHQEEKSSKKSNEQQQRTATTSHKSDAPASLLQQSSSSTSTTNSNSSNINRFVLKQQWRPLGHDEAKDSGKTMTTDDAYSSATSLVAHIVRDWTPAGRTIRQSLYTWCTHQLQLYLDGEHGGGVTDDSTNSISPSRDVHVLVPGAGLGRLAYDIAQDVCIEGRALRVEANDCSVVMAAASYPFVNHHHQHSGVLHPYAADPLVNEVCGDRRTERVATFPDIKTTSFADDKCCPPVVNSNSLSYTIGDFVHIYSSKEYNSKFHAVVTCFFIDTATYIYEYVAVIRHMLNHSNGSGGLWINVGPVQWHQNALVHPSVDELRHILEHTFGFEILFWQVDKTMLQYRSSDDDSESSGTSTSFTRAEGYYPLRFVVKVPATDSRPTEHPPKDIKTMLQQINNNVKRLSMLQQTPH